MEPEPINNGFKSGQSVRSQKFSEMLDKRWREGLFLCVGLDPDYTQLPGFLKNTSPENPETLENAFFEFCRLVIDSTAEFVCSFKPNLAFFEQDGPNGLVALKRICDYIHEKYSEIPVILDAKRGDIASTNKGYAASLFDYFGGDAITVQPYLGGEALEPYLQNASKGVFILCRTSNPGSAELQNLPVTFQPEKGTETVTEPLYLHIARLASGNWNYNNNTGLVAGATYPDELALIRKVAPEIPLLVPGVGAQGGDLDAVMKHGLNRSGTGLIINSSRGIIYAGKNEPTAELFAEAAGLAAHKLATDIKTRL